LSEFSPVQDAGFGFGAGEASHAMSPLRLPNLLKPDTGKVFASLTDLISGVEEIAAFEMEFTRFDLGAEFVKPLEDALRLHSIANQVAGSALGKSSLPEIMIALWLSRRSGWRVTIRALIEPGASVPHAALEMAGRDLLCCECEVVNCADGGPRRDEYDLSGCFPRGWPFPAILPTPDSSESLVARRLHNPSIPNLPKDGLVIGAAEGVKVRLPIQSRDRHTYIVGATGTGKSTLLSRMIREDIKRGEGVILLDPHGDLYREVRDTVPPKRRKDLFLIDPCEERGLPGLNILDIPPSRFRHRHAAFLVGELFRFFDEMWDMRDAGGPIFEMYFRNTLLLMCLQDAGPSVPREGGPKITVLKWEGADELLREILGKTPATSPAESSVVGDEDYPLNLGDFTRVMTDDKFRKALLRRCPEKSVVRFWSDVAEKTTGDHRLANYVPYIVSKINGFVQTGFVADMLCSRKNDLRIGERIDRKEIILVNLNKGLLGAYESRLLGTILMMELFAAGLGRSARPKSKRTPVNVYVDEFQNFVSDNVAAMLSEARKFGLRLTLANQTLAQLKANPGKQDVLETVLGNVGNIVLFRLGVLDAVRLQMILAPFSPQEMQELPNYHAMVRLQTREGPIRPIIMRAATPQKWKKAHRSR